MKSQYIDEQVSTQTVSLLIYVITTQPQFGILLTMNRQDRLLILSTFLVGFTIGVYAYFAGFSGVDRQVTQAIENSTDTLVIVGEAYGGCDRADACPSFQVTDDGEYRYFYQARGADEQVLREGTIPADLQDQLREVLVTTELQVASRPVEPAFCESYVDGIDVGYRITLNETDFVLDSCGTDVDGEGRLWVTLSQIWTYFETVS